jgi:hypothetical protein
MLLNAQQVVVLLLLLLTVMLLQQVVLQLIESVGDVAHSIQILGAQHRGGEGGGVVSLPVALPLLHTITSLEVLLLLFALSVLLILKLELLMLKLLLLLLKLLLLLQVVLRGSS